MKKPDHVLDIFLNPGEFYFGDKNTSIRTLLGSCVSLVMWHPTRLIGGMCHYVLPFRLNKVEPGSKHELDGRFAEEAMEMFFKEATNYGTHLQEYVIKVFGAANMLAENTQKKPCSCSTTSDREEIMSCTNVSCKNEVVIHLLARQYDLNITTLHMGGNKPRNIIFDLWSGEIRMRLR